MNPNYWPKLVIEYTPVSTTTTSTTTTSSTTTIQTTTTRTTTTKTSTTAFSTTISSSTTSTQQTSTTVQTTTTMATTTTIPILGKMKRPIIVTDGEFHSTLLAASTGYPVLVWNESNEIAKSQQELFVEKYRPTAIISVNTNASFENVKNYEVGLGYFKNQSKGYVICDDDRSKCLYMSFVALFKNYTLIPTTSLEGGDFEKDTICDFNYASCNMTVENENKIRDYLAALIKEKGIGISNIVLANSRKPESALAASLGTSSFPVVIDVMENYTGTVSEINSRHTINDIVYKIKTSLEIINSSGIIDSSYSFEEEMFLSMLGTPFAVVDDPWVDDFDNVKDGSILFTDNPYYDVDSDGYPELSVGRFCCSPDMVSLQINNARLWDRNLNNSLILAEYRIPKYLDLFYFEGMTQGFSAEWFLRSVNFDVVRLIENRTAQISENILSEIAEKIKKEYHLDLIEILGPKFWLEKAYEFLGLKKFIDFKYGLLEYDWNNYDIPPQKLPSLNWTNFAKSREYSPLIFYFGKGDEKAWFFPNATEQNMFDLYTIKIKPESFDFRGPKIIFDEHSLSGYPQSSFASANNLVLIGSTGIVHDTFTGVPLILFLRSFAEGKSLGYSVKEMKKIIFSGAIFNATYLGFPTTMSVLSGLKLMQKENYEKILYGDPRIRINPRYTETNYGIFYENGSFVAEFDLNMDYHIVNSSVDNETYTDILVSGIPQYYLYDIDKPPVPVFSREIILPAGANIENIEIENSSEILTVLPKKIYTIEGYENISYNDFPENNLWLDYYELLDGRKKAIINFAPVIYNNEMGTEKAIVSGANVRIYYDAEMEILNFSSENISYGQEEAFEIYLSGEGPLVIEILIRGEDKDYMILSNATPSRNEKIVVKWFPPEEGVYTAYAIAKKGDIIAGPRITTFSVKGGATTTTLYNYNVVWKNNPGRLTSVSGPSSMGQDFVSFKERVLWNVNSSSEKFTYQSSFLYLEIEKSQEKIEKILKYEGKILRIITNSTYSETGLTMPDGSIKEIMNNGVSNEICDANCPYMRQNLSKALTDLAEIVSLIEKRILSGELPVEYTLSGS